MDKMFIHTLVKGLEDATIAKDVIKEYTTNNDVNNCLTLKKIDKVIEAMKSTKRSRLSSTGSIRRKWRSTFAQWEYYPTMGPSESMTRLASKHQTQQGNSSK